MQYQIMDRTFFDSGKQALAFSSLKTVITGIVIILFSLTSLPAFAQFEAAEFEKISRENRAQFERETQDISLTGQ